MKAVSQIIISLAALGLFGFGDGAHNSAAEQRATSTTRSSTHGTDTVFNDLSNGVAPVVRYAPTVMASFSEDEAVPLQNDAVPVYYDTDGDGQADDANDDGRPDVHWVSRALLVACAVAPAAATAFPAYGILPAAAALCALRHGS